ncbi:MAG: DegT/DnrJ/EryC1/StrS family aminotransferase [Spirochaetaceae bacterium]|jgi:dTDP-4-amino-4,6-dideoxygalactose transaminase|nr:DegT/DnrJ/EryC1/StrS family aminotransferase [Spirochaetaceae bacterium]
MKESAPLQVPFFRPSLGPDEEAAVLAVMRSGWLTTGNEALAFEQDFAAFTGAAHALAVNSATSGLLLAMDALGVGPGTAVVTTPYTFVSTALAAIHLGARILYADVEKDTYNIDPLAVEACLAKGGKDVRAIVPVHVGGALADMAAITEIARRACVKNPRVAVIEDAAHAFPSRTVAGFAGTLGDAGVFSFYANKTITTGEGGMVCLRDKEAAQRVGTLRLHGIDRPVWNRYTSPASSWEYDVVAPGWKCNLPDILAAIGRVQLKKADSFLKSRMAVAQAYNRAFAACDFLQIPPDGEGNAWHLYLLRIVPEKLRINRDEFMARLQEAGIGVSMHFIPHYRFSWLKNHYELDGGRFPNAERRFQATISLPLWPGMTGEQAAAVVNGVIAIGVSHYAR